MRASLRVRAICALGLLLLCAVEIVGQNQQPSTAGRLDGDGDLLPESARFRVGTKRWRHGREAAWLVWTPDGRQLAYISKFHFIRVLDADTGRLLRIFTPKLPTGEVVTPVGLAVSPDGKEMAVSSGGRLFTFEWETGKHLRSYELKLEDSGSDNGNVCYSADGKYLALAEGSDYAVLDRKTGDVIVQEDTSAEIQGIEFTRDSTRLVVASLKPSLKVWELANREITARWTYSDDRFVWGPGISPDGKLVAIGQSHVEVVDPAAGEVKAQLRGDDAKDLFLQVQFTPDGRQLVAASQEGPVYVWKTSDWSRQWKLTSDGRTTRSMALRPDGKRVAVGDAGNRVWVWSLETGELLFNERPGHDTHVHAVAFTPDGQTLITGGGARDTHLWSVSAGQHVRTLNTSSSSLALSPDAKQLLTAWYGGPQLRAWDLQSGQKLSESTVPETRLRAFAVAAEQPLIAILCDIQAPRGFRLLGRTWPTLAEAGDVRKEGNTRGALAISPDGRLAGLSPIDGVDLWSLADGQLVGSLANPDHFSDALLFTPDGRFVVANSSDKSVLVWEVASCRLVHRLVGHSRVPAALALHPSGRVLASAGGSRSIPIVVDAPQQIRFWDLAAGKQIAALSGHNENVSSLAFSFDGKLLAAGLRDTTAIVWDVPAAAQDTQLDKQPLRLDEAILLWKQLAEDDASKGQAAVLRLSQDPARALSQAEQHLTPAQAVKDAVVDPLIARLDADDFKDRTAAYTELAAFGAAITPQLRAALGKTESVEVKQRCARLLEEAQRKYPQSGTRLSQTRAVQLLEQIADERAQALLARLAGGDAEAHLTVEAKAAARRIQPAAN